MKYHVSVGDLKYEVVVDGEEVLVDGRPCRAELLPIADTPIRHLMLDGKSSTFAVASRDHGTWALVHRGEVVEVEVLDERTRHLRTLVGESARYSATGDIKAPMPGLVVRVLVEPGQEVVEGQGLVILEAMKMENELKAPRSGTVEAVSAMPGQAVERGAVLVVIGGR